MKSVLVDFLISAGIKPTSIVSYNHLGNNDGKNLSAPEQFRSKEISKSNVVDDMVASNRILYKEGESYILYNISYITEMYNIYYRRASGPLRSYKIRTLRRRLQESYG